MSIPESPSGLSLRELIQFALQEDLGDGDHTSLSTVHPDHQSVGHIKAKQSGIIAGVEVALLVAELVDPTIKTEVHIQDGAAVESGTDILLLKGKTRSLLKAERLLLNCMQRMSGIATMTRQFTDEVNGTSCKILDTRKTTPNFRLLEKWAVRIGGGTNHRYGLFDMILIKDNHVDAAGGIAPAIINANNYLKSIGRNLPIEIETRNLEEVKQALSTGHIQRIMLDNFSPEDLAIAVRLINKQTETEASGGINLKTAKLYASTGVDFLSVGALTHSYVSMDISMKIRTV
jgi:nicotinate-nucleotide pyrophosphorylase (carboxylating)